MEAEGGWGSSSGFHSETGGRSGDAFWKNGHFCVMFENWTPKILWQATNLFKYLQCKDLPLISLNSGYNIQYGGIFDTLGGSTYPAPMLYWNHIAIVFDRVDGMIIYNNGTRQQLGVVTNQVQGKIFIIMSALLLSCNFVFSLPPFPVGDPKLTDNAPKSKDSKSCISMKHITECRMLCN